MCKWIYFACVWNLTPVMVKWPKKCRCYFGFCLSVDRLSLQHFSVSVPRAQYCLFYRSLLQKRPRILSILLFCFGASFSIGICCWKNHRELKVWKVDDRVFECCQTSLQHLALVKSNDFWVSFWWICRKLTRKMIDRQIRSSFPGRSFAFCKLCRSAVRHDT